MRARELFSILIVLAVMTMAVTAWSAAAPSKLSYQAVLLTAGGQPVTTPVTVVSTIYDAASGGSSLWSETRNVSPDASGRVNVMLGNDTPIAEPVFGGSDRWLGIRVGADPEMSPRTQFAASPYSRRVSTVDGSSGGTMDGNLTLRSTAAFEKDANVAQAAQLTLISLDGDTIVVGPADQLVFRATNSSGSTLMSATIDGPNGPVLGISDPGGNVAQHGGSSSSYYGNSAKDGNAMQKRLEIGENGISVYDASGSLLTNVNPSTGGVTTSGLNISPPVAPESFKSVMLPCGVNAQSLKGDEWQGNLPVGNDNDLTGAAGSLTVGRCNTLGIPGSPNKLENATAFGLENTVLSNQSFVSGQLNFADKGTSNLTIFGTSNTISTGDGVQSSIGSSILGGQLNFIYGPNNTIMSGNGNRVTSDAGNTVAGSNNTISGGNLNRISGSAFSFIAGGERNIIDIDSNGSVPFNHGVIGGGADNRVSNNGATISGGYENRATGWLASIGGGSANEALGTQTTVGGGVSNTAGPQNGAVVAGGEGNTASGQWASVGGGIGNMSLGDRSHIGGGSGNSASGNMSVVAGGMENNISIGGDSSCVVGGYGNMMSQKLAFIGGGMSNNNSGYASVITGGVQNFTQGNWASIGGGQENAISTVGGSWNTVAGGLSNEITGSINSSAIGGGVNNAITSGGSTIAGGNDNRVSGNVGTVPGGLQNLAAGEHSFAAGSRAKALHNGSFCISANHITTAGDSVWTGCNDQFVVRADGGFYLTNIAGQVMCTTGVFLYTSTGAHLTSGGAWTNSSDRNLKENFTEIDEDQILDRLATMPIEQWSYKAEGGDVVHIGPTAQDFRSRFGLGSSDKSISTVDADGIALAAIKALHKKTQELESQKTEIDELRDQISQLKRLVESMSRQR